MKLNLKRLKESPGERVPFDWTEAWVELDYKGRRLPFVEAVRFRGEAVARGDAVHLTAELATTVELECSRCLRPIRHPVHREERMELREEPEGGAWGAPLTDFRYEHGVEVLDLAPYVESLIRASIEAKPLCRPDCKGLCPACGRDLNEGPCEHARAEAQGERPVDPRLRKLKALLAGAGANSNSG